MKSILDLSCGETDEHFPAALVRSCAPPRKSFVRLHPGCLLTTRAGTLGPAVLKEAMFHSFAESCAMCV